MLEVLDVSSNNNAKDEHGRLLPLAWDAIVAAGIPAVIVKATEGVDYIDPAFWLNIEGARHAGLLVLTYHYLRVRHGVPQDAAKQVAQYAALVASADLPPRLIVDCETNENESATSQEWGDAVRFARMRALADCSLDPCLYTSPGEWRSMGGVVLTTAADFAASPLWVADTRAGRSAPEVPPPFPDWTLWQYTWKRIIAGVRYDASWFRGSLDDLKVWAGASTSC